MNPALIPAILFIGLMLIIVAAFFIVDLIEHRRRCDQWRHIHFDDLHSLEMLQRKADFESECG